MDVDGKEADISDLGDLNFSLLDWTITIWTAEDEFSHFEPSKKELVGPSINQIRDYISEFIFYCKCMEKLKITTPNNSYIVGLEFHENGLPLISLFLLHTGKIRVVASALDEIVCDLNSIPSQESILRLLLLFYQLPLIDVELEPETEGMSYLSESFHSHLESMK